jgi:uncharacterized RDD family membrane protein YckC
MVMEFEDFITLSTPEGVELDMSLAGAGSRMLAGGIDLLIKLVLIGALAVGLAALGTLGPAVFTVGSFLVLLGYDVLFEVAARGQTPAKRFCGLRVVRTDGSPVDLRSSGVRNIMRLVDGPTFAYVPTVIGILATRNNQRPGDLAADTIVVRAPPRRRRRRRRRARGPGPAPAREPAAAATDWDVSAIGPAELAVVRRFLERRDALPPAARRALALQLAEGLRTRVTGAPDGGSAERFLETLLATKAARGAGLAPPRPPG